MGQQSITRARSNVIITPFRIITHVTLVQFTHARIRIVSDIETIGVSVRASLRTQLGSDCFYA
jgi:hypothetical protein